MSVYDLLNDFFRGQLVVVLASAGAVLALIAIAWLIGFRQGVRIADEAAVARAVEAYEPGAVVQHALIDRKARAALARLADGRFAIVKAMGDRFAVRLNPAQTLRIKRTRAGLRAQFADLGFPALDLRFGGAPPIWLQENLAEDGK